jgi:hypothetical protein
MYFEKPYQLDKKSKKTNLSNLSVSKANISL